MMMYFVTLAPGRWKFYQHADRVLLVLHRHGHGEPRQVRRHHLLPRRHGVFVNLFIASELNWTAKGVRLRQETRFPDESATALTIRTEQPKEFSLRVRVPGWATKGVTAKLNGEPLRVEVNHSRYVVIRRTWSDGDRLDIAMPMSLHVAPMPDDKTLAAFMYGPLVLAGKLGGEGLTDDVVYLKDQWYRFPRDRVAEAPVLLAASDDLTKCIEKVTDNPPTFRTVGLEKDITLVPYHQLFGERYVIYWRAFRKGSPEHAAFLAEEKTRRDLKSRTVDEVEIGDPRSERAHGLKGERMASGLHFGRTWRHAERRRLVLVHAQESCPGSRRSFASASGAATPADASSTSSWTASSSPR